MADKIKIRILNKTEILAYWSVSCALCEGFKLWLLGSWWNISKNKNGGQEVTWSSNLNKALWIREKKKRNYIIKSKSWWKNKRKGFSGRSKNIRAKKNCTTTNFTPALSRTSSLNNTTQTLEATQTFDDDQTPSMSWVNITKTSME